MHKKYNFDDGLQGTYTKENYKRNTFVFHEL